MRRNIEAELLKWKKDTNRCPLLVRGARQVGKSFIIEQFGKNNFNNLFTINFELQPQYKKCFESLDPESILNKIQLLSGQKIDRVNTLLFLDEIQECPAAIMAMRYFKEKHPEIFLIGAGSLLEFALAQQDFRMPVGRITFLFLYPLSFGEFLSAINQEPLRQYLAEVTLAKKIDEDIHQKLLEILRIYLVVGGMPGVIKQYLQDKDILNTQHIQASLLQTYQSDFSKYSRTAQIKYLQKSFLGVPRLLGQQIKYVNIDTESRAKDLRHAIELLVLAGAIHMVQATKATGLPLGAETLDNRFKLLFLDVGLAQNLCGLNSQIGFKEDFLLINRGAIAEQYVGQELLANSDCYQKTGLYYWSRENKSSMAEVDYVLNIGNKIYPLEIKAGSTGRMKSIQLFLAEKSVRLGVRISQKEFGLEKNILSLPLYMIEQLPRIITQQGI